MSIELRIEPPIDESEVLLWRKELTRLLNEISNRVAAYQADSTATDVTGLKADFNALLAKLRTAGLMESS